MRIKTIFKPKRKKKNQNFDYFEVKKTMNFLVINNLKKAQTSEKREKKIREKNKIYIWVKPQISKVTKNLYYKTKRE